MARLAPKRAVGGRRGARAARHVRRRRGAAQLQQARRVVRRATHQPVGAAQLPLGAALTAAHRAARTAPHQLAQAPRALELGVAAAAGKAISGTEVVDASSRAAGCRMHHPTASPAAAALLAAPTAHAAARHRRVCVAALADRARAVPARLPGGAARAAAQRLPRAAARAVWPVLGRHACLALVAAEGATGRLALAAARALAVARLGPAHFLVPAHGLASTRRRVPWHADWRGGSDVAPAKWWGKRKPSGSVTSTRSHTRVRISPLPLEAAGGSTRHGALGAADGRVEGRGKHRLLARGAAQSLPAVGLWKALAIAGVAAGRGAAGQVRAGAARAPGGALSRQAGPLAGAARLPGAGLEHALPQAAAVVHTRLRIVRAAGRHAARRGALAAAPVHVARDAGGGKGPRRQCRRARQFHE